MLKQKILFIDRDGTLIEEPTDEQVDRLEKFKLKPNVVPALIQLRNTGFRLVMISNQDGLGTPSFPLNDFTPPQEMLLSILSSQGIQFDAILICSHKPADNCDCRKPKLGLVLDYLRNGNLDLENSYVIGDRETDVQLANNMGIKSIRYGAENTWSDIAHLLTKLPRVAKIERITKETKINIFLDLDKTEPIEIKSGICFFDHMLGQLAKHSGISMKITVDGDLHIDDHHTVEDVGLLIGAALRQALGDKLGINRYGFLLPMDDALTQIALDLSGRPYFIFSGKFNREKVGELSTELVPHFFRSFSETLGANLNIQVQGENTHHVVESIFKGVGRTLRQAITRNGNDLPTTKGLL